MAAAVITRADLDPFRSLLLQEMHEIITSETPFSEKWPKTIGTRELLKIPDGYLQNLRINGTLSPAKIGFPVSYSNPAIGTLMEANKAKSFESLFN